MYTTKQLLPARGRLTVKVLFTRRKGYNAERETANPQSVNTRQTPDGYVIRSLEGGHVDIEIGNAQSVNVKNHFNQMFEEAILNAFYKLNHRIGGTIFNKNNYNQSMREYVEDIQILSYYIDYFEDRIYSYSRNTTKSGKHEYIIRRKGKVSSRHAPSSLSSKQLAQISDSQL